MNAGMIINRFGKKIPHCSVDTVTQAVMQLIEDPTCSGTCREGSLPIALYLTYSTRTNPCCATKRCHQEH